ncbi:hypothetical protein [Halobacterium rubrum]|uniref:hypothetical protein n=1 Tax=Halobacterium TaxID=2239 RepID=UPI001F1DBD8F|nr:MULTISPECIES: hypothetical protein [Halobacterium]MDH5021741.1 hypothetical protein [Halobacterium rubrum]
MARQKPYNDLEADQELTITYERRRHNRKYEEDPERELEVEIQDICERTGSVTLASEDEEFRVHADGEVYGRAKVSDARRVLVGFDASFAT